MTQAPASLSWWAIFAMWIPGIAVGLWTWRQWRDERRERNPDPEAVMALRQLHADGEFRRHWIRRSPRDLNLDRLELECGHWMFYGAGLALATEELLECDKCARQYLKSAQKGRVL